ncbi:MAG: hypothetical protein EOP07_05040 [Proteobacteria bacterium]|nr:MAG: hypothetical protein EOP07_05040 [Pseudomonadota bacterium]
MASKMKIRTCRFWRLYLAALILLSSYSCKTLNLNYNEEYLFCGSNFPANSKFLNVTSPDNKRLEISDLQLINLETQIDESKKLSSKGCLTVPSSGRYMIRSLTREWASIFDSNDLRGQRELKLNDFSHNNISINCDSSQPTAVSQNFSIQSILLNNVAEEFQEGYKVEYEVTSEKLSSSIKSNIPLNLVDESSRPFLLSPQTNLNLVIKIKNLLKNQYILEKSCPFVIDSTPPNTRLATNLENSNAKVTIKGEEVLLVNLSDSLSFLSEETDVKEIRFCRKLLNDDFDDLDLEKTTEWKNASSAINCPEPSLERIAPNATIPTEMRQGIWAFTYQAVDILGNISVKKQSRIIFHHKEEIELIKSQATSKVSLAVQEMRSLDAIKSALDSEKSRLSLSTKYEREEASSSALAGLTNAYYQKIVSLPLAEDIAGCTRNFDISNDGKFILCAKGKTNLVVWDVSKKKIHREFNIVPSSIEINTNDFLLSGSGKVVATFKDNFESSIWNLESGVELIPDDGVKISSNLAALDSDGTIAVDLQSQELFQVFNLKNGNIISRFPTELGVFDQVKFSANDQHLIVYSESRKVARIIDTTTGTAINLEHLESLEAALFTPDSKRAITASRDGWVKVWDTGSGTLLNSIQVNPLGSTRRIRLAADDQKVLVLDDLQHFYSYRIEDLRLLKEFEDKSRDMVLQLRMPKGSEVAYTSSNRAPITAWFLDSGKSERVLQNSAKTFGSLAFEKDGHGFYTSSTDLNINHWNTNSWEIDRKFPLVEWNARNISLSPDENSLVFLGKNPTIMPIKDGNNLKEFPGHFKGVDAIVMSHNQQLLATCSHDYSAMIWSVETMKALHTVTNAVGCDRILFTLDDKIMIVHSSADIFFWDVATGSKIRTLNKHLNMVTDMGLFADGLRFYSAASDKTIRIWDIKTGENIQTIDTGEGILKILLTDDQKSFLVLHAKEGISIWDAKSGTRTSTLSTLQYTVQGIGIFPDGRKLLSFDNDGFIQVWDQSTKGLVEKICNVLKPHFQHELCARPIAPQ